MGTVKVPIWIGKLGGVWLKWTYPEVIWFNNLLPKALFPRHQPLYYQLMMIGLSNRIRNRNA